jgi:hypothetical protein
MDRHSLMAQIYQNTRTNSKDVRKIKDSYSTIIITQVEFDLYSNENICLLSDGTRIPERYINFLYKPKE